MSSPLIEQRLARAEARNREIEKQLDVLIDRMREVVARLKAEQAGTKQPTLTLVEGGDDG